jgi:hypothetical protein
MHTLSGYKIITTTYDAVIYAGRWYFSHDLVTVRYRGRMLRMPLRGRCPTKLARSILADLVDTDIAAHHFRQAVPAGHRPWI